MKDQNSQDVGSKEYPDKKPALKGPRRKYAYFRDDQFLLLVTHNNQNDILEGIEDFLSKKIQINKVSVSHVTTFPAENEKPALSLLKCSIANPPDDPLHITDVVKNINQYIKDNGTNVFDDINLVGSSANWLSSVTSQGGGTGGPGGRPTPYYGSRAKAPFQFTDLKTNLQNNQLYGDGTGVDVVILDSAPSIHDLVAAPKEWPDHPIISTLLGPNGKLKLYPASYAEMLEMGNTSLNDHDYKMTDHGLFIAGIIHSIVPNATIHLVEVLNPFGVGDFGSFVRGLEIVRKEILRSERKLVINCSWMLEIPVDDLQAQSINTTDPDDVFKASVNQFAQSDQQYILLLKTLFDQFLNKGRQAIAAAGNDVRPNRSTRVKARYPAALSSVIGVGALPKSLRKDNNQRFLPSNYSNIADTPGSKGVMTLGGEAGEGNGILGVYIGDFPDCSCNTSKWAWWSGTSFATPILTGSIASVLSSVANITSVEDALQKLYPNIIKNNTTPLSEDAMPVIQE